MPSACLFFDFSLNLKNLVKRPRCDISPALFLLRYDCTEWGFHQTVHFFCLNETLLDLLRLERVLDLLDL